MIGIDSNFLIACEASIHAQHAAVRQIIASEIAAGETFALCPQVVAEFIHVVTDPKRFSQPLDMETALRQAERWSNALEVKMFHATPDVFTVFFAWMRSYQLGRKRVLDTMIAAIYAAHDVTRIATIDQKDFQVFGVFQILAP
jgi:predicted nucleic acid-binding protein